MKVSQADIENFRATYAQFSRSFPPSLSSSSRGGQWNVIKKKEKKNTAHQLTNAFNRRRRFLSFSAFSIVIQRWLSEIERNRGSYRGKRKTAAKVEELTGWVSERERERTKRSIFAWYLSFSPSSSTNPKFFTHLVQIVHHLVQRWS